MMKYLLLMFAWWGVFTTDGFSADGWRIYADFSTDEVLALKNVEYKGLCTEQTRILYSTNNGKYIPLTIASFQNPPDSLATGAVGAKIIAYFPAKSREKYVLTLNNFAACGTHINCKNPDGTEQGFMHVGRDSSDMPTVRYGDLMDNFHEFYRNPKDLAGVFSTDSVMESLTLITIKGQWHLLYKSPQTKKYIELNITSINPANASWVATFPNDPSKKKYKMKMIHFASGMSYTIWVTNPDKTTQLFRIKQFYPNEGGELNKTPAQLYTELLGK